MLTHVPSRTDASAGFAASSSISCEIPTYFFCGEFMTVKFKIDMFNALLVGFHYRFPFGTNAVLSRALLWRPPKNFVAVSRQIFSQAITPGYIL